jgi:CubicO group peptidase (beta-lactamase class C family)
MSRAEPRIHLPDGGDFLLLAPTQQAHAYRSVDRMFATRTVARGDRVRELPRGEEIAPRYRIGATEHGVDDYIRRGNVAGLLVIRHGAIVLERYALGLTETTRWSTMSMVKSVTSTLVGTALRAGAIRSLDDAVPAYLPALRGSAYDTVRVRDLLTMSSGVGWNEDYADPRSDVNQYSRLLGGKVSNGVLDLLQTLPAVAAPGTRFNYNTGDTFALGCLVTAAAGTTLAEYLSRTLWQPLGMECDAYYTLDCEGGQEIGGSRAGMTLRDLGRFGGFILRGGIAPSGPLLPDDWVACAATPAFALDPGTNSFGATGYGYSWWLAAEGAMVAVGFAGQSLLIDRAAGLVAVTLSCQPQPPYARSDAPDWKAERAAFHAALA